MPQLAAAAACHVWLQWTADPGGAPGRSLLLCCPAPTAPLPWPLRCPQFNVPREDVAGEYEVSLRYYTIQASQA